MFSRETNIINSFARESPLGQHTANSSNICKETPTAPTIKFEFLGVITEQMQHVTLAEGSSQVQKPLRYEAS